MSKKTKIHVLGASGYLGGLCVDYFRSAGYQVFDNKIDVTNLDSLREFFKSNRPDVAINLTGPPAEPNIDWCENHKEETVKMIVAAPINFSVSAIENGIYPIQITSGCIYNGGPEHEFTEEDEPNFSGSFYSRMRVAGQKALAELPVLQARIRMPMSTIHHPRNFLKIAAYKKVVSIPNSITFIDDLWPALEKLMTIRYTGVLNMTNDGYVEHKQVLDAYKKIVDPGHSYELISLEQLEGPGGITKAKRSNCVLSTKKARSLGINMPALTDARLTEIMEKYKLNL